VADLMLHLIPDITLVGVVYLLFFGHFLGDFPLQNEYMALGKDFNNPSNEHPWGLLIAHCAIHGGIVGVITGYVWLGVAEVVAHFAIDSLKISRKTGFYADQILHLLCKMVWGVIAYYLILSN
jgi:hypothetical protein